MKKNIFAALFLLAPALCAAAEAPNLLTYQGRLKESGLAVTGNRAVEIFLCSTESGGPACETTQPQFVAVSNGLFRSTFTVPGTVDLTTGNWWLEIKVAGVTLTPRERLTSGAYSLYASTAAFAASVADGSITDAKLATGISASKLTGALPAISGAALTDLPASGGSVAKTGDTMTGQLTIHSSAAIVNSAADQFSLAVTTDPARRVYNLLVSSQGRVGVGVGSLASSAYLQVMTGGSGNFDNLTVQSPLTSAGYGVKFQDPGGETTIGRHTGNSSDTFAIYDGTYRLKVEGASGATNIIGPAVSPAVLYVSSGISASQRFATFNISGRLGLGNTTPAAKLDVIETSVHNSSYTLRVSSSAESYHLVVTTAGFVGIGAREPKGLLHLAGADGNTGAILEHASGSLDPWAAPWQAFLRARGSMSAQALVADNDPLGALVFMGYDGAASADGPFRYAAAIKGAVDGAPGATGTDMPGRLEFYTTPDGAGELARRLVIRSDGTVGIGTGTPYAVLDIVSTGTAANVYAQIWRNGSGIEVASMTSQGVLYATLPSGSGDGLGAHTASQNLNLAGFNINSAAQLTVSTVTGPGSAYVYVNQNLAVPASKVAIGNGASTSGYPLAVYGDSGAIAPVLNLENKTNGPGSGIGVRFSAAGAGWGSLSVADESAAGGGTSMRFETISGEVMRLHGARVGVGAAVPDQKLTVNGNISQTGVIISSGTGDNFFAGNVYIGKNPTAVELDVFGNINASGSLCIGGNCKSAWPADPGTQDLDLAQHSLLAVSSLTMYGSGLQIATDLTSSGSGIFISTAGSLQTLGFGNGTAAPGPRGIGAVDLQTKRIAADQVASGIYSVIGGGYNNKASTPGSVVAGGQNNYAGVNSYATVSGGSSNSALMTYATVGGGSSNAASEAWAFVGGGGSNKAQQTGAAVTGGQFNVASASNSAVGGGKYNTVSGTSAVVSGGENNAAGGMWSGVAGGRNNAAGGNSASVGGGYSNAVSGDYSAIAGGLDNSVTQPESFIGGGQGNSVTQSWSVVAGGNYNTASGQRAFVGGGVYNTAGGTASMVPGGWKNSAVASFSFAAGKGSSSTANGSFTWADSKTEADSGYYLENTVEDRAVFKAVGGFMVVNSTDTALYGTRNRGVFVTGGGLLGISTGTPGAALDVVSEGTAAGVQAQIWRNSSGVIVSSLSSTGLLSVSSITATGRMGIGTGAPRSALDLWGGVLYLGKTGMNHGEAKADDSMILTIDADNNQNNAYFEIKAGLSSMATVLQPGVMGIGTADPKAALDVKSTGTVSNVYAQIWRSSDGTVVSSMTATGMLQTAKLDVNSDSFRIATPSTITNSNDPCNQGEIRWDASYVYVCVSANTWRRATLGTW